MKEWERAREKERERERGDRRGDKRDDSPSSEEYIEVTPHSRDRAVILTYL